MISEFEFISNYKKNKKIQTSLMESVNSSVKTVDYKNNNRYRYDSENGGVFFYNNNKWEWSWVNSINTNYSCLYLILKHIVSKYGKDIGYLDFEPNYIDETLGYLRVKIEEDKQTIFTPKSTVFRDMFFTTQKTWNKGLISEISALLTLKKHYEIGDVEVNYKRGDSDDMKKGTDLKLFFEGGYKNTQHKSANLFENTNEYVSTQFLYNEKTYRENLDLITIDYNNIIYLFYNSKDTSMCGTKNGKFFINKNLEKKQMVKEEQEFADLLTEMNKICFEKRYIFNFEKGDAGINYFEDTTKDSIREINFYLNDINDTNLINIVKEQITKL
jgi:hypothetical protein